MISKLVYTRNPSYPDYYMVVLFLFFGGMVTARGVEALETAGAVVYLAGWSRHFGRTGISCIFLGYIVQQVTGNHVDRRFG